jgi:hypothetical protein
LPATLTLRERAVMDEAPGFDALRRQGLALAQEVSGRVWTDFNLHDPGVTLLEQFCYALTELAYRADFPVADLLTGSDGRVDYRRLGLPGPREVFPTRPVTARDLALTLAEADPAIDRVLVEPLAGAEAGLYDLFVVPVAGAVPEATLAAVRCAFHANRNLCEDLRTLALAEAVPCRLEARVEVRRRDAPERIAALIYDRSARLMRNRGAAAPTEAATRCDVFDDPARMYGVAADPEGGARFLDLFFAALTELKQVDDVISLTFSRLDAPERDAFAPLRRGQYRGVVLPERPEDVGLEMVSRDLPIPFDLGGMRAELARIRADHLAELRDRLDPEDWAEPPQGRRRRFDHVPLGDGLPAVYGVGPTGLPRSADPRARAEARQLRGYLALADAVLANADADLASLGDLYAGDAAGCRSYFARPLDFGPMPELAAGAPGGVADAVAEFDSWHDRRGRFLDYLLALQGEELPQNSLRLHDVYRGSAARRNAILKNRARLLAEAPVLNRDRAAAADYARSERCHAVGLGRKLAILLDFPDRGSTPLSAALSRVGLTMEEPDDGAGWRISRARIAAPEDPFATFVPRLEPPVPALAAELIAETAFLSARRVGAAVLRHGVQADAYVLAPEDDGGWRLLFDPGASDEVFDCAVFPEREAAILRANQLREFFVGVNRASEGLYVVEDVLLRGAQGDFESMRLTVVGAGWSARAAAPDFRRLVGETVALLCPAHIAHRVHWLDLAEMARFETLHLAWRVAYRDAATGEGLRAGELHRSGSALRAFLAGLKVP